MRPLQVVRLSLRLLVIAALWLGSCAPKLAPEPETATPPASRSFVAAFARVPQTLFPAGAPTWHQSQVLPLLYNGLTTLDAHLQPIPALASRWEISPDGLMYTLYLHRGVTFHDGSELDTADVRYSFQRAGQRAGQWAASSRLGRGPETLPFAMIAMIQTLDAHTVRFILKAPYAPFLTQLTVSTCPIIPDGASWSPSQTPPGTGPFQLDRFEPGRSVHLKKYVAYWEEGLPRLERLTLKQVPEAAERLRLLQIGQIDYALLAPTDAVTPSAGDNGVVLVTSSPTGTFSLVFNTRRPPFAKSEVRRAVAWAVDKAGLTHRVLGSYGVPISQPFGLHPTPWTLETADRAVDVAKVVAHLQAAGYTQGVSARLPVLAGATLLTNTALDLQSQLQSAGINLQVDWLPVAQLLATIEQGDWDLLLRAERSRPDPDEVYFTALHSASIGWRNASGYQDPALDALLTSGRQTRDTQRRHQLYQQVAQRVHQELPELYLFMARWPVAWGPSVQGYDAELLRCCFIHSVTEINNQGFKTLWLAP